ncbi:MAG: GNAT family N-acetyltransferase [Clostridia bacterium]|nr:GNAT family N-acetyltransferase [Clostridia bacterium]
MEDLNIAIVSVREKPEIAETAIDYISSKWTDDEGKELYRDCIGHTANAEGALPEWFLAVKGEKIVGCAGVIPNDFVSRMDLMPYLCALFVEEDERNKGIGRMLISRARAYAGAAGFRYIYLCTDHVGYYERYGGEFIAMGVHPWKEKSRIYRLEAYI